jgi:hypothetical protein
MVAKATPLSPTNLVFTFSLVAKRKPHRLEIVLHVILSRPLPARRWFWSKLSADSIDLRIDLGRAEDELQFQPQRYCPSALS